MFILCGSKSYVLYTDYCEVHVYTYTGPAVLLTALLENINVML